jgi:hypothetical protein
MQIELEDLRKRHSFKAALSATEIDFGTIRWSKQSRLFTALRKKGVIRLMDESEAAPYLQKVARANENTLCPPTGTPEIYSINLPFRYTVVGYHGYENTVRATPKRNILVRYRCVNRNRWYIL